MIEELYLPYHIGGSAGLHGTHVGMDPFSAGPLDRPFNNQDLSTLKSTNQESYQLLLLLFLLLYA